MFENDEQSAVLRIPSEIWLRIALRAEELSESKRSEPVPVTLAVPTRSYMDLPTNLAPGSAPLTPLGPVSTGAISNEGAWGNDYFGFGSSNTGIISPQASHLESAHAQGGSAYESTGRSRSSVPDKAAIDKLNGSSVDRDSCEDKLNLGRAAMDVLLILSTTCKALRSAIWPLLNGQLRVSLSALSSNSDKSRQDIWDRISAWAGHVRDLELAIDPCDDFLAHSASRLFETIGSSLETLTIRFDPIKPGIRECDSDVPPYRQIRNSPSGIYIPRLVRPLDGAMELRPLFPRLKSLRVTSTQKGADAQKIGNLHTLICHAPSLLEVDFQGAKMDLAAYMVIVDMLQSMQRIRIEVLHLNLVRQYATSVDSASVVDAQSIQLALHALTLGHRALTSLKDLSIVAYGGVLELEDDAFKSLAVALKRNYPLLRNLELPLWPGSRDTQDACMAATKYLIESCQEAPEIPDPRRPRQLETVAGLADLNYLTFKLSSKLERVMMFRGSTGDVLNTTGPIQEQVATEDDCPTHTAPKLRLAEVGKVWRATIRSDANRYEDAQIIGSVEEYSR